MKRPWNRTPNAVYSLVTKDPDHGFNMNIMTYVTAVSMNPKMYLFALDPLTKSHSNFVNQGEGLLQCLSLSNASQVRLLGKTSAHTKNKFQLVNANASSRFQSYPYLDEVNALMLLTQESQVDSSGLDHDLFLCRVTTFKNIADHPFLTTQDLIEQGLIL